MLRVSCAREEGGRTVRRKHVGVAIVGALAVAAATACSSILSLDDLAGPATDASTEGGGEGGATSDDGGVGVDADPCAHVWPPLRAADDDPTKDVGAIVLAMRMESVKGRLGWDAGAYGGGGGTSGFPAPTATFGFDLDNACTCQRDLRGGAPSCKTTPALACDQDGGVDNGMAGLFKNFGTFFPDVDALYGPNAIIQNGDATILFQIASYNGSANDDEVIVTLSLATRPHQAPASTSECAGAALRSAGDAGTFSPIWDGCDEWDVIASSQAITAYVVDHQLVVIANSPLPSLFATQSIGLQFATFVGVLVPSGKGFTLEDGVIAGRARASDMLTATLSGPTSQGQPACFNQSYVNLIKGQLCAALDLRSQPSEDFFNGGELPCNAISLVQALRAESAHLGDQVDAGIVNVCADSGADLNCP
jgi:hypothetical protein